MTACCSTATKGSDTCIIHFFGGIYFVAFQQISNFRVFAYLQISLFASKGHFHPKTYGQVTRVRIFAAQKKLCF
jgi:hypothetical protein